MARVLAIGDIHGCSVAFDTLLAALNLAPDDVVVTLGDYVDRGPRSRQVVDRLIELSKTGRLVPILGNHDQMMLDARSGDPDKQDWLRDESFGVRTLASYGVAATLADVPATHWEWMASCRDFYETATHFFVHANAYPEVPLDEQPTYMLRWESFDDPAPHMSGKVMVCGHTSQKSGRPRNVGHAVCIDTWPHGRGGWLTCLDVTSGRIWQANEEGDVSEAWLDDFD
jgi:serine/threonine protein phosphatase 1